GTTADPYLVGSADQLDNVRLYLDKSFKLIADIDLGSYAAGSGWLPIGTAGAGSTPFIGSMDGNGFEITNLTINRPGTEYVGLFGATGAGSSFINMKLVNVDVTGGQYTGSL